jgi:hypothetical protein
MYQLGKRSTHTKRALLVALVALLIALATTGLLLANHYLKPDTKLAQAQGLVTVVTAQRGEVQQINEPVFSLEIPKNWKAVTAPKNPYNIYSWRGTTTEDAPRSLDIYVDTIPANFVVNRLMPVQVADNRLVILNTVSDNCANFTGIGTQTPKPDSVKAKWAGVDFLCDMANINRNVTGIGSVGGINTVTLSGPSGKHSFFFTYTDNSGQPDFTIFTAALQSFKTL